MNELHTHGAIMFSVLFDTLEIPMKVTTLNRSKLTTYFAGEEVKFMTCIG
jgi:hypothetical protein